MPVQPRETALLCESCGYVIDGLAEDRPCPECGTPVVESLPTHRPGSPWQRRPGLVAWVKTNAATLSKPSVAFRHLRITIGGIELRTLNLLMASLLIAAPWPGVLIGDPARSARHADAATQILAQAVSFIAWTALAFAVLWLLTFIEGLGIRFIAARRGWRLTKSAASQTCSHASIGWVFAGIFPLVMVPLFSMIFAMIESSKLGRSFPRVFREFLHETGAVGLAVGYLLGMLVFEYLVYIGVRQNKFANELPTAGPRV